MNRHSSRRHFIGQASAGACGWVAGNTFGADKMAESEQDNFTAPRLVVLGLNALARAHEMNYFADGHRGASLVAAHLLCSENHLPGQARARIEQLFDLNWAQSPLCQPFPAEEPDPSQVKKIGAALAEGRGELREVGHNAIFAMLAIRGFRMLPELATPKRIDGICKLIRAIKPWRDTVQPAEDVSPPIFSDGPAASAFVLREASAAIDKWTGFGQGFSGHLLTFGQALVELAEMGDVNWAESCRAGFCKYVTLTRKGPGPGDKAIVEHSPSALRPNRAEYWHHRVAKQVDIGHVFKYPYSYYDLLRRANNPALAQELDAKAYRLF